MDFKKNVEFDIKDKLSCGLAQVKNDMELVHPIQTSEKNFHQNRELASMEQLRKVQGLHAPLRIQMEKKLVSKAGHLPREDSSGENRGRRTKRTSRTT